MIGLPACFFPDLPEAEVRQGVIAQRLWLLLCDRAREYTLGESDSLPQELAQELLSSLLYTLKNYLDSRGEPMARLGEEGVSPEELYRQAAAHLAEEWAQTKARYAAMLPSMRLLEHRALRDTLKNIGVGLKRYPYLSLAHIPPCDIDYQLCLPVPESLQGLSYLREYLRRLWIENQVLARFDQEECRLLLESRFPDYRELLVNLYEPVMSRALGRVLTNEGLSLPRLQRAALGKLPRKLDEKKLRQAAQALCRLLRLPRDYHPYVEESALQLLPRYRVALENGTLSNLF